MHVVCQTAGQHAQHDWVSIHAQQLKVTLHRLQIDSNAGPDMEADLHKQLVAAVSLLSLHVLQLGLCLEGGVRIFQRLPIHLQDARGQHTCQSR